MFSRSNLLTDRSKRKKEAKSMTTPSTNSQKASTLPAYHAAKANNAKAVTNRRASETLTSTINRLTPFPRALLISTTNTRYPSTQRCSAPLHIEPSQILFSNFNATEQYEMTLSILNCSHQKQYVRIVRPESSVFNLSAPKGPSSTSMIAPGLSLTYVIYFQPTNAQTDYSCELTVITEHDSYNIPVHAFANRGKLELPDTFAINDAPLRGSSRSSLFIRNCSFVECVWRAEVIASQDENEMNSNSLDDEQIDAECKANSNNNDGDYHQQYNKLASNAAHTQDYEMSNKSSPETMCNSSFSISPCRGTFAPDSTVTPLEVTFAPTYFGIHNCTVRFFLGLEEEMIQEMTLIGNAIEIPVLLEPTQVEFSDLFITTESESVVRVCNDSSFPLHFAWKNSFLSYAAHGDSTFLTAIANNGDTNTQTNCEANVPGVVVDADAFDDEVFSIEPNCGIMQANSTREFTIHFNPQLAICYETTAFLELTGRRDRVPLLLHGSGVGPQCQLEFTKLHIGDVYMHALHEYCVSIENVGCIEARYVVLPPSTHMGKYFTFSPSRGVLSPAASEMLTIQFESPETGEIAEKFKIHLHGSTDDLTLEFRGTVVGPTFEFDVSEIEFGDVSFAFTHTRTFQVHNTSHVPLAYQFHFPSSSPLSSLFAISPSSGCIAPMGSHDVNVSFSPINSVMTLGNMESVLEMDVIGIADRQARLPIKVNCVVPMLELSTNTLDFKTCFLNHTYTQQLAVTNNSSLPCKFTITEVHEDHDDCDDIQQDQEHKLQESEEESKIRNGETKVEESVRILDMCLQEHHEQTCTITLDAITDGNAATSDDSSAALRIVGGHETTYINIQLCAHTIHSFKRTLAVYAAGTAQEQAQRIIISGAGCGPDVHADVNSILFGTIPVLTQLTKIVTLHNNSLIPAEVELTIKSKVSSNNTLPVAANESKSTIGKRESKVSSHTSTSQRTTTNSKLENKKEREHSVQHIRQASIKDQGEEIQKEELQEQEQKQHEKEVEKAVKYESIFVVEPTCVVIEPNSSTQISVTALPNDAMTFTQEIECVVKHNEVAPIHVMVKCTGSGFPLVVQQPDNITEVDFDEIFTENSVTKEVVLENKGRRILEVQWHNVRGTKAKDGAAPIVFTYKPERVSIAPRECANFTIEGFSNEVGKFVEHFVLKQSGTFREVMRSCVSGLFIAPTLKFSVKELVFDYVHNVQDLKNDNRVTVINSKNDDEHDDIDVKCNKNAGVNEQNRHTSSTTMCELYRSLTMQNMTNHKLHIKIKLQDKNGPFALDEHASSFFLNGGESQVISVRFNPLYRGDYVSHALSNRLLVSFDSHAQVEKVKISASVLFPSLCFSPALHEIDFGAILVDSEVRKTIKLINESPKLPARFTWNLIDIITSNNNNKNIINNNNIKEKNSKEEELQDMSARPNVVAERVFDFVPFKGEIAPNASLEVHVVFNGKAGKHCMNALCQIHGGPSLPLRLCGEASVLNVSFDKTVLDFGVMPYYAKVTKSLTINNVSHVPTSFTVNTQFIKHHGSVNVSPMSGTITDKARLTVTFSPTVPDAIEETFTIHVGHCDPQIIHVNGAGIVHTLSVLSMDSNVPVQRSTSRVFASFLACLRSVAHSCYEHHKASDSVRSSMVGSTDDMNSEHGVTMRYAEVLEQCQLLSLSQLQEVGTTPYLQRVMKTEQQPNLIDVCEKEAERLTFVQHILQLQQRVNLYSFKDTIDNEAATATTTRRGVESTMTLLTEEQEQLEEQEESEQQKKQKIECNGLSNNSNNNNNHNHVFSTQAMPLQRVMRRTSTSAMDSANHKYILSCYTVDFGHLTRTAVRSTRVKLLNTSFEPMYVSIDSKEISYLPVTVSPLKLPKIGPMQSATLEITLDASGSSIEKVDNTSSNNNSGGAIESNIHKDYKHKNKNNANVIDATATAGADAISAERKTEEGNEVVSDGNNKVVNNFKSGKIKAGENKFEFALDIKGGPAVVLQCRCYIATPSLRVSPAELVFGELVIGQAQIMPFTLYNEQAVPCTWVMTCKEHAINYSVNNTITNTTGKKSIVHDLSRKDANTMETNELMTPQFWCSEVTGTVSPLSQQTIEVYFAPHKAGEMSATLHFRFVKNNIGKGVEVKCTGAGKMLNVEITQAIHFPTMKPFEVLREPFTIINHEPFPVEVVSINHDGRHVRECELLHNVLCFQSAANVSCDSNGSKGNVQNKRELLLAPLHAGDYLPLDVLDCLHVSLQNLKKSICSELTREVEEEGEGKKETRSLSTTHNSHQHYEQRQNVVCDKEEEYTNEIDQGQVDNENYHLTSHLSGQSFTGRSTNLMQKSLSAATKHENNDDKGDDGSDSVNTMETNEVSSEQNNVAGKSTQSTKNSSNSLSLPNCFTVLIGPPQSGKTSMTQILADKYNLHRVDLNELIANAAANDSITGVAIRQILESNKSTSQTPCALSLTHQSTSHKDNLEEFVSPHDQMQNSAQEVLEQLNELESVMFGTSPACVSAAAEAQHTREANAKEHYSSLQQQQQQQQQQQNYHNHRGDNSSGIMNTTTPNNKQKTTLHSNEEHLRHATMENNITSDVAICIPVIIRRLLVELIRKIINCNAESHGFVMDGLTCCLTNDALCVFRIVQSICTLFELPIRVVSLAINETAMALRVVNDEITHCHQRVRNAEMQPLSESEYDTLSPDQQLNYNIRLQHLNVLRRELAAKHASREHLECELTSSDNKASVQSQVEHEYQLSQDMELTMRTMRKSTRRITPVETTSPIHWENLSPVQVFKTLYSELIKQYEVVDAAQEQNTPLPINTTNANTTLISQHPTPVNSGRSTQSTSKKQSNHTNSKNVLLANKTAATHDSQTNIIYSVNAEQMKTALANDIISVLRRASTGESAHEEANKPQESNVDTENHNNGNTNDAVNNADDKTTALHQSARNNLQIISDSNESNVQHDVLTVSKSHIGT